MSAINVKQYFFESNSKNCKMEIIALLFLDLKSIYNIYKDVSYRLKI